AIVAVRLVCRAAHSRRGPSQGKWREALARLLDDVTRLAVGAASGVGRWSGVSTRVGHRNRSEQRCKPQPGTNDGPRLECAALQTRRTTTIATFSLAQARTASAADARRLI